MKFWKPIFALVLVIALLTGCAAPLSPVEKNLKAIAKLGESPDDNYRVWYEVFVYAFADSNGDGIGDLNGLRSKLPYLQELGVNGIWLMPIHPSTTYHKYNVSDYYAIDPDYGTLEDFQALLKECDALGIRVIMDLVVNHTGSEHPWFKEAVSYLQSLPQGAEPDSAQCPYLDYYSFVNFRDITSGYSMVTGTEYAYEAQFSYDMPDLNWDCPAVREEIEKVMKYWLDMGVAGFRIDAAKEFFSGRPAKNVEVLSWLQETSQRLKPGAYMVAEVWDSMQTITEYYESGITSIFDYPYGNSSGKVVNLLRGAGKETVVNQFAPSLQAAEEGYRTANPNFIDAPFLSNHDVGRIYGFMAADTNKMKLAGAVNLLMSGSAFIYYGEEIGMPGSGNDPSKRAPFLWNEEKTDGTCSPAPDCKLPKGYPLGSLAAQKEDETSVYNYYRQAIAIRKALPALSHGVLTTEEALNQGCVIAMRRTWNEDACIVLMNVQDSETQVDLSAYKDWQLAASLSADGGTIAQSGTALTLPPFAVAILRK